MTPKILFCEAIYAKLLRKNIFLKLLFVIKYVTLFAKINFFEF